MSERFSWYSYSKKSVSMILNPHNVGFFTEEEAQERKMLLALGRVERAESGCILSFYWLVDPLDGTIVDCRYQLFGDAILIALAEVVSVFLVGKNYDQARHLSGDLIERRLRDKKEEECSMESMASYLNLVIDAIDGAAEMCGGLPLPKQYATPIVDDGVKGEGYAGWVELGKEEKLRLIEELFSEEIRPYIELDEGGVKILDLVNGHELLIAYEGACTSCYSSIGTTLSSIQQILQMKLHPSIVVVPNMDALTFA